MRERNITNKMSLNDDAYKSLWGVVHDEIIEVEYDTNPDREPTNSEVEFYITLLSNDVLLEVERWDAGDTLVREQIHEEIERIIKFEKEFEKGLLMILERENNERKKLKK